MSKDERKREAELIRENLLKGLWVIKPDNMGEVGRVPQEAYSARTGYHYEDAFRYMIGPAGPIEGRWVENVDDEYMTVVDWVKCEYCGRRHKGAGDGFCPSCGAPLPELGRIIT